MKSGVKKKYSKSDIEMTLKLSPGEFAASKQASII